MPLPLYCFISVAQPVCAAADTSRLKVQTNVMRADNGAYYLHHCLHALLIDNYYCPIRRKHTNGLKHQTRPLMGARRPEAAEKCPTRDASPPLERNALAQQSFTWFLICFLICKSDRKRYHYWGRRVPRRALSQRLTDWRAIGVIRAIISVCFYWTAIIDNQRDCKPECRVQTVLPFSSLNTAGCATPGPLHSRWQRPHYAARPENSRPHCLQTIRAGRDGHKSKCCV